ncbi:efflux RND transporter periplasmic adaptor subunit [Marinimicrobium sp. ABcell2]|uniref:efflux RND transporter periplasmic adaptor subunit n=1 Tax=Marinimicrobium sp. ABcell2 TaxID=3069751 RepID=UPI0027B1BF34|nr:efflux RND transporter periplasmic adaptor subunit [Marinimicrobium sp. ABcell2]MDQ2076805.1 efflux RND transporter periplasmic adaptor subunit [Marinimicrobium sp. ABcell2]
MPAPMLFRKRAWLVTALCMILAVLALWWILRDDGGRDPLATATVSRGNVEALVTATGVLQPRNFVDVGAQVSGQLKTLHVNVGDQVQAGDLLAEIDATVYLARVDGTRAQLRNQQAQLKEREAQLTLAEIQLRRQQDLVRQAAGTREQVEVAEANLRSAEAQVEALEAQLEQTQSTLRAEEANLQYARIFAPMDGTVVSIDARQGQTLNAAQQTPLLMRIADLATMTVQAQVSEADIGRLEPGMPVYFNTMGSQSRRWEGELSRIEPTPEVENNVVLYSALFDVPNEGGRLLPQMTAQVFFITAQAKDALILPVAALRFGGSEGAPRQARGNRTAGNPRTAQVQVLTANGQREEREVQVGVTDRVHAEILSGLTEGEEVIIGLRTTGQSSGGDQRIPRRLR